ncbi:hypothetical protein D3C80_1865330 [compost metagenome]
MQYPFRSMAIKGLSHWTKLTRLIAGNGIAMRNLEAFGANVWCSLNTKMPLIGLVGGDDVVLDIQDDGGSIVMLKVRNQRLNIYIARSD